MGNRLREGNVSKVRASGEGPRCFQGPEMGRDDVAKVAKATQQEIQGTVSQDLCQALWCQGKWGNWTEEKFL